MNVQGDEPLIAPRGHRRRGGGSREKTPKAPSSLSRTRSRDRAQDWLDPNAVKVVTDARLRALFLAAPIPSRRPGMTQRELAANLYYKHIGLYVYPKDGAPELTRLGS